MSTGKIFTVIPKIMAEVGPIAKDRQNKGQGYNFRGVDDVYEALQLILAKHGVFTVPEVLSSQREERTSKSGGAMIYTVLRIKYTIYADDGSFVVATLDGEGMDSGDKASNKGLSVAHKYLFLQLFCIPTREAKDPEDDSHDIEPKKKDGPERPEAPPVKSSPSNVKPINNEKARPFPVKTPPEDAGKYAIQFGFAEVKGKKLEDFDIFELDKELRNRQTSPALERYRSNPKFKEDLLAMELYVKSREFDRDASKVKS